MLSKDYILDFVEGEGCFSLAIGRYIDRAPRIRTKPSNIKNPYLFQVKPMFVVTNVESNKAALEEIKEAIGFGRIFTTNRESSGTNRNICQYRVQALSECLKVKDYFQELTFRTEKGKDFENWCKCLEIIKNGGHLSKEGIPELCHIRDQMNTRKTKNKWTTQEIQRVLEEKPIHQETFANQNQATLIHNSTIDMNAWIAKRQGNTKPTRATG